METRRLRSRLRTKTDSDLRNRYTTAPLVINHAIAIDFAEKAFLQANREHKQERINETQSEIANKYEAYEF